MKALHINGNDLMLEEVREVAVDGRPVLLAPDAREAVDRARAVVDALVAGNKLSYAITTGVGKLSDVRIAGDQIRELQVNLVRSHAVGVGDPLSGPETRAMMLLRANSLAKGHSGVRAIVIDALCEMLNRKVTPFVPSQGSVGASGDLAPLAHLALVLVGEGECLQEGGKPLPGADALRQAEIKPLALEAKEAVSNLRSMLEGSQIRESHRECGRVQDAYSLRCIPQVHGAVRDTLAYCREVFETEANSAVDNPLVFVSGDATGDVLSGGNFHGEPVAFALDFLGIALSALAGISERRIERLVNPALNEGLPPFLAPGAGLNSGFMMPQVTAAALVSENKVLAHPASVDSITTSGNKEDYVSMGMTGALKLRQIVNNTRNVLAIEAMAAAQALDFVAPLKTGKRGQKAHDAIRSVCAAMDKDRVMYKDFARVAGIIAEGKISEVLD